MLLIWIAHLVLLFIKCLHILVLFLRDLVSREKNKMLLVVEGAVYFKKRFQIVQINLEE